MSCISKLGLEQQPVRRIVLYAGLGIPLLAGCGGPDDVPELGTVSGTINKGGEPLAGAWIVFEPEKGRVSAGRTDEEGYYTLQYNQEERGAKVGSHTVKIGTGSEQRGDRSGMTRAAGSQGRRQLFQQSGVKVDSGENVIEFEITKNNEYQPGNNSPQGGRGRRFR